GAGDEEKAAEVAMEQAKEAGPDATFDSILVPALCLARRDHHEGDLDAADLRFIVRAAHEIAEEVADLSVEPGSAADYRARVLICPARDESEHVAAEILALMLDTNRWEAKVAGDGTLASELVELVAEFRPQVVIIATLPPGGQSHSRYLITRLRRQFPDLKLLVGRWGC